MRGLHSGAPGRLHEGEFEVAGTMAGIEPPAAGSVELGYGVRDWVSVEGGATYMGNVSATGWFGPRFTLPRALHGATLLLDGEAGIGGGAGGDYCPLGAKTCPADGLRWWSRAAGGGYEGGAVGFGYEWFSLYLRARAEETFASSIPYTIWVSGLLGLGFDITRRVSLDIGGGAMGYLNNQSQWGPIPFWQGRLSVRFGK
jgi:hypothetical protein